MTSIGCEAWLLSSAAPYSCLLLISSLVICKLVYPLLFVVLSNSLIKFIFWSLILHHWQLVHFTDFPDRLVVVYSLLLLSFLHIMHIMHILCVLCLVVNHAIDPSQGVWLTDDLTNHNAESAIFVQQTNKQTRQEIRLTLVDFNFKKVCFDIFPWLKQDTFWCSFIFISCHN